MKIKNINLGEITKIINDLTKTIRQSQTMIDQTSKNYIHLQGFNEKLIEFERLFLIDRTNTVDETSK